jgi:hypothetical protein
VVNAFISQVCSKHTNDQYCVNHAQHNCYDFPQNLICTLVGGEPGSQFPESFAMSTEHPLNNQLTNLLLQC